MTGQVMEGCFGGGPELVEGGRAGRGQRLEARTQGSGLLMKANSTYSPV